VFALETVQFLERGSALIVGAAAADGEPCATRGWGLQLVDDHTVRVLVPTEDARALDALRETGAIAITGGDVVTLRSVQFKGRVASIEPATEADWQVMKAYSDAFFRDVEATDGTPRALLERLLPVGLTACTVTVDAVFDQTPGPSAGATIGPA
jgi:hypothetical protein